MAKSMFYSTRVYVKNMLLHTLRVIRRKETTKDAVEDLRRDAHKLRHSYRKARDHADYAGAMKMTKKGREAYNSGRFDAAADYFRQAIELDPNYPLGYTYLGHAFYKLNRMEDAIFYWRRAIEVDPDSEAAEKARRKLAMTEEQKKSIRDWMRDVQGD